MNTHFLKFDNKQHFIDTFSKLGVLENEEGGFPTVAIVDGKRLDIDILYGTGTIWLKTGQIVTESVPTIEVDENGVVSYSTRTVDTQVMLPADGFHVNVSWVPDALFEFEIPAPQFPKVVFSE